MFGLFKKKKPNNAFDEIILAVYGNPPPSKTANLDEAAQIAHEELLMGVVSRQEVVKLAANLDDGSIPYSTHDLALSAALHFFKQPDLVPHLGDAQMMARLKAMEWLSQEKVVPLLVMSFEDVLYKLYKPGL